MGWTLARRSRRGGRYLQGFLVVAGLMTVIAVPLMLRKDTQPESEARLLQSYGANSPCSWPSPPP